MSDRTKANDGAAIPRSGIGGTNYDIRIWHNLADCVAFGLSVWLAARVVSWHTFNFVGFSPVNLQACHSKYQGSCGQAETFSLLSRGIDFLGQALAFAWKCHSCFLIEGER